MITQPLNEYQVNNRKGSERIVDGYYIDSDGNFLIDRLTTEGTELGSCNACQDWNVETLKLVDVVEGEGEKEEPFILATPAEDEIRNTDINLVHKEKQNHIIQCVL